MKFVTLVALFAIIGIAGVVQAAPERHDESTFTLDLRSSSGEIYFVKCANGRSLLNCGMPSLWAQNNELEGLQTVKLVSDRLILPDHELLG